MAEQVKSRGMPGYLVYQWWAACVETRIVTEDGAYADGEVPEDYSGPKLETKVLQRIIFSNSAGEILELRYDNLQDVMNSAKQTGLGANVSLPMGASYTIAGSSSPNVAWELVMNPKFPTEFAPRTQEMWQALIQTEGVD